MKILITGATGLIGRKLVRALLKEGHNVVALSLSAAKLPELPQSHVFSWSDDQVPTSEALSNCDVLVHLAGEGIADQRWTKARKKRIRDSRIDGTKNLVKAIAKLPPEQRPKLMISGSAIGYYSPSENPQDENSSPGQGFLSTLCLDWEAAAKESEQYGLRTVLLRTGLVLTKVGGVLSKTGPIVLGNGQQWMSWIHIDDMVRFILFAIQNKDLSGPYNLTAPNPVTNQEFTKAVSQYKGFPLTLNAPKFALNLALGELAEAVLANQKVFPTKTLSTGFQFQYTQLDQALNNLIEKSSITENFFSTQQFVPMERKKVFHFFSKAENLETLTPPWLNFHIDKMSTPEIRKGTLIDYKLKIHGVPTHWQTCITEWNPESSFIDDQIKGPYRKWHHVHTFEDVPGGTLITDEVTFEIPGWIFGKALLPLIKKDVQSIFKYRQQKIKELFL